MRSFLSRTLSAAGYTVKETKNGADALEALRAHPSPVDLILSDVVMPPWAVRAFTPRAGGVSAHQILFITGYAGDELAVTALSMAVFRS